NTLPKIPHWEAFCPAGSRALRDSGGSHRNTDFPAEAQMYFDLNFLWEPLLDSVMKESSLGSTTFYTSRGAAGTQLLPKVPFRGFRGKTKSRAIAFAPHAHPPASFGDQRRRNDAMIPLTLSLSHFLTLSRSNHQPPIQRYPPLLPHLTLDVVMSRQ